MSGLNKKSITTAGTAFMILGIGMATGDITRGGHIVSTGGDILVQIMPSLANFTSELHLFYPERRYLTTNRDTRGAINLGNFPLGSELIFGIFVRDTGNIFMMGPGDRNPDGIPHASVQIIRPGVAIVKFKDVWGEQNEDIDNSMIKFEKAIADVAKPLAQPATVKGNLVFGNFNVSRVSKRKKQQKAV